MQIELTHTNGDRIPYYPGLPPGYLGKVLMGSEMGSLFDRFARVVVQQIIRQTYSIAYLNFRFATRMTLLTHTPGAGLYVRIMLQSNLTVRLDNLGKTQARHGRLLSFVASKVRFQSFYQKNRQYRILDCFFSKEMVEDILNSHESLPVLPFTEQPFIIRMADTSPLARRGVKRVMDALLHSSRKSKVEGIHLDEYVDELLTSLLTTILTSSRSKARLSASQRKLMHDVREYVEEHYMRHITLTELARKFAINGSKLKTGFNLEFGIGVHDCRMQARMRKARELVDQTEMSIKEIAFSLGFTTSSNFISSFRSFYGEAPGQSRPKYR